MRLKDSVSIVGSGWVFLVSEYIFPQVYIFKTAIDDFRLAYNISIDDMLEHIIMKPKRPSCIECFEMEKEKFGKTIDLDVL